VRQDCIGPLDAVTCVLTSTVREMTPCIGVVRGHGVGHVEPFVLLVLALSFAVTNAMALTLHRIVLIQFLRAATVVRRP
jgi:hypothetical protein